MFDELKIITIDLNDDERMNYSNEEILPRFYHWLYVHETISNFQSTIFICNTTWNNVRDENTIIPEKIRRLSIQYFIIKENHNDNKPFNMFMTDATRYWKS